MCRVQWAQCGWSITQLCWLPLCRAQTWGQCCVPRAALWAVIPEHSQPPLLPPGSLGLFAEGVSLYLGPAPPGTQPWKPADVFPNTLLLKALVKPEMQWLPRTFLPQVYQIISFL